MTADVESDQQTLSTLQRAKHYAKYALRRYSKLHIYGKLFIWAVVLFYILGGIVIIVLTPAKIAQFMYDKATEFSKIKAGWIMCAALILLASFPPVVGHTTLTTLSGFAYGLKGFYIAAGATLIGSALVFETLRFLFSRRLRRWSSQNERWQALEDVIRAKGLPLIILIRISPFPPYIYNNTLFASIEPVKLWQFLTATVCLFPKLLLHVFIGSRIASFADGDQRRQMDTQTKVINGCLIGGGILIAIVAAWLVYNLTQKQIRKLRDLPPEEDELAAEAIEDYGEEAPLLSSPQRGRDDD